MDLVQLAHVFGCLMKKDQWYACPLAHDPYIISKNELEKVKTIQPFIQQVKSELINDPYFINQLKDLNDDFIMNLLNCRKEKKIEFGIIRSDYISDGTLKNVETNCIASSFGYLSDKVTKIHQIMNKNVVPNCCMLAEALNAACELYDGDCTPTDYNFKGLVSTTMTSKLNCILMIIQPNESNICDQIGLLDGLDVPMFRITFDQVWELTINKQTLYYQNYKVAVVYYRAGYTPNDYPSEKQVEARKILEHSNAINCPSISLQLMGLKKIQQLTSNRSVLLKYLTEQQVDLLMLTFMGLYSMDQETEEGKKHLEMLTLNPDNYVLKPQREGGSNNYYGQQILDHLKTIGPQDYKKYILMEKITSISQPNTLTRYMNGHYAKVKGSCISEIGIYGYFITKNKTLIVNKTGGHLVRTKLIGTNEGGVASGYSYLNALKYE